MPCVSFRKKRKPKLSKVYHTIRKTDNILSPESSKGISFSDKSER